MARVIALGADMVNSARAMMMAVGCIQALQCNTNACPVGVATQDQKFIKGLDVADKTDRIYNFHKETIKSFIELMAAAGVCTPSDLTRIHINRRVSMSQVMTYKELYPEIEEGSSC